MTSEEFKKRAQAIYDSNDGDVGEEGHIVMDDLLIECLNSSGYPEGINTLLAMSHIWYA